MCFHLPRFVRAPCDSLLHLRNDALSPDGYPTTSVAEAYDSVVNCDRRRRYRRPCPHPPIVWVWHHPKQRVSTIEAHSKSCYSCLAIHTENGALPRCGPDFVLPIKLNWRNPLETGISPIECISMAHNLKLFYQVSHSGDLLQNLSGIHIKKKTFFFNILITEMEFQLRRNNIHYCFFFN